MTNSPSETHPDRGPCAARPSPPIGSSASGGAGTTEGAEDVTVVVLAGGTSRRFGSQGDDKLDAPLGPRSLLETTLAELPPSWRVIIVGPPRLDHHVCVRECPPGGGPAAGVAHASGFVETPWCAVLAGDTPRGGRVLPLLLDAARSATHTVDAAGTEGVDGAIARVEQHRQPLLAAFRTDALVRAAQVHPATAGLSMRALLAPLTLVEIDVDPFDARDVDTLDDLEFLQERGTS